MAATNKSTCSLTFGEAVAPFRNAGVPARALLPIAPPEAPVVGNSSLARNRKSLGKVPGRFDASSGEWTGLGGNAITEGLDKRTRAQVLEWPTGNVGVLGRVFPAIDVDVGSEGARQLVERTVRVVFGERYAERLRGTGPRCLFAFRSDPQLDPSRRVSKATWEFRMPDDREGDAPHKVDILGYGQQFVAAGIHPSGDSYGWHPDRDLCAMVEADRIEFIERADIERLREEFERAVREIGGTVRMSGGGGHAAGGGQVHDYRRDEPIAPAQRIIDALWKVPNTEANFPNRDDLIGMVSAIRAAAGRCALDQNFEDEVRGWAVNTSDGWCTDDYFDKAWDSLRSGVRCGRDRLSIILRKHGVRDLDGIDFENDRAADVAREISGHKADERNERQKLLDRAAKAYVFQHIDTSNGRKFPPMRLIADPSNELDAVAWYKGRSTDRDGRLLADLHREFGKGEDGLFEFHRALMSRHPLSFYRGTTKHPGYDFGAIVPRPSDPDHPEGMLNLRRQSQAQSAARKNRKDPDLARADVAHFRDFVRRAFGDEDCITSEGIFEKFVLDTLGYMAQTGKRPGHMIYLVGDQGTGKSIFVETVIALFDGTWPDINGRINGAKLINESARRFIFEPTEGCRVVALQEMPKNAKTADQTAILSELKQAVDPGPAGDWLQVEGKNGKIRHIENHALVIVTTNYEKALEVEEQDRRTFYAPFRITIANKPNREFYARLVDIAKDPERLAAIWQFLDRRDISGYRVTDAPPTTAEKFALQIAGIHDDAERHMEVTLRTFEHCGRWIFTQEDIVQLMNEAWRREGEDDSGPEPYSVGTVGRNRLTAGALKRLHSRTEKSAFKSGSKRYPTLYVMKSQAANAAGLQRDELFRALAADRDERPLREMVPITPYRGELDLPSIVEEAGADGADDEPGSRRSGRREGSTVVNLAARRRSGSRG